MNDLRFVLLLAGIVALLLLWFIDARRERNAQRQRTLLRERRSDEAAPRRPRLQDETPGAGHGFSDIPVISPRIDPYPEPASDKVRIAAGAEPGFVALFVTAPAGKPFAQESIFAAAAAAGLHCADDGVFHMPGADAATGSLFTMANLHEPGTFSRDENARPTRGVALILPLPAEDPGHVLDLMLHTGELLAGELGGMLVDESRQSLDAGRIARLHGIAAGRRTS